MNGLYLLSIYTYIRAIRFEIVRKKGIIRLPFKHSRKK